MIKNLTKYIHNIPKLPEIIVELDSFRKSQNKNSKHLTMIIKKDKNLHQNILKVMDFNIFDFDTKPKNITNFIAFTNLEFVTTLATALTITKSINLNLFSYAVTTDDFLYSNTLAMRITDIWINKIDKNLKNELLLPAFLQGLSKPIISLAISENKLTEKFLNDISTSKSLALIEEKFTGYKTGRITANILKNWGLSYNIIFPIAFSQDLINCPKEFRLKAIILNIINNICNLREPLSDKNIHIALEDLALFDFDIELFLTSIDEIKNIIKKDY
ncbi:HDOD domain-containing protein [Arcobacter lanthieri]|uniref:HDOD domain-containing protein n=1 Tax=Aliarcobacter lanthieri TaxID=1355374 RepID=UPI0019245BA4|nr:HDOD domain-containing protein [Aliarcobacter lanthieri]MBL3519665.1 HDOD domain-containing protein [Aliarcobacter lanthieri]